jgi:hypothetical protein
MLHRFFSSLPVSWFQRLSLMKDIFTTRRESLVPSMTLPSFSLFHAFLPPFFNDLPHASSIFLYL